MLGKSGAPEISPYASNSSESVSRHAAASLLPYLTRNKLPCPLKHTMGNASAHPVPSLPYVLQNTRLSASAASPTYVSDVWYAGDADLSSNRLQTALYLCRKIFVSSAELTKNPPSFGSLEEKVSYNLRYPALPPRSFATPFGLRGASRYFSSAPSTTPSIDVTLRSVV